MTEYWEPESLVAKLVVGAKVRIRLSNECQIPMLPKSPSYNASIKLGHETYLSANGKTGVITRTNHSRYDEYGHRFTVRLDELYEWNSIPWRYVTVAAIELEPV